MSLALPWRIEIEALTAGLEELGIDLTIPPTDQVILRYLRQGDLRPLLDLLSSGHNPDPAVLDCLAEMGEAGDGEWVLKATRRDGKPGRPVAPETTIRDMLLSAGVRLRMKRGQTYEAACRAEAEEAGVGYELVRKAADRYPDIVDGI